MGIEVVSLDPTRPFTAARARNVGFERLLALVPSLELAQFVDADCELAADWLDAGAGVLRAHPDVAAVVGRLRDRRRSFLAGTAFRGDTLCTRCSSAGQIMPSRRKSEDKRAPK